MQRVQYASIVQSTKATWSELRAVITALLILLPLAIFAGAAALTAIDAYRAADEERLAATARALAAAVDAQLAEKITALQVVAESRRLSGEISLSAFEDRMRPVGDTLNGRIILIGPPPELGVLAISHPPGNADTLVPSRVSEELSPDLRRFINAVFVDSRPFVSDLFVGPYLRRLVLAVVVPINRAEQQQRALALTFDPAALRGLLVGQLLPDGTFAAIADGRERILAHSRDPEGVEVGRPAPSWVSDAIAGKQRAIVTGPGWTGNQNIYAVERVARAPDWTVTVAQPVAAQQAAALRAITWLLAGGVALALGLGVAVWFSRQQALRDVESVADALRQGRAEIERLHRGLPAVIFLRDVAPDGSSQLLYRGGDMEKVTGWPAARLSEQQDIDAVFRPGEMHGTEGMQQLLRVGHASSICRLRQPDGGLRLLHFFEEVLEVHPNGHADVVGYIIDETSRLEAEARALTSTRLASLGEMAAGLAHQLKQPLATAALAADNAEILIGTGDLRGATARVRGIAQQMLRAGRVIDHLRRFSSERSERIQPTPVRLEEVMDGVRALIDGALLDRGVELSVDFGDTPPIVMGDVVALEQVLVNLLCNASDALSNLPREAPRRVGVTAVVKPDGLVAVTVADTGGGIAPDVLPHLFEPFVTTKKPDKGVGLGLSICHRLVEGMGGTIEAANGPDGAVFTICLKDGAALMPQV